MANDAEFQEERFYIRSDIIRPLRDHQHRKWTKLGAISCDVNVARNLKVMHNQMAN